ncbi:MAG: hypothetical protein WCA89_06245, partial [Terracidiphilus sp.]
MAVETSRTGVWPSTTAIGRGGGGTERAVLVGVDLGAVRSRGNRAAQAGTRQVVVCPELAALEFDEAAPQSIHSGVSPARTAPSRSSTEL